MHGFIYTHLDHLCCLLLGAASHVLTIYLQNSVLFLELPVRVGRTTTDL